MKQLAVGFLAIVVMICSCTSAETMTSVQPKAGSINLPAKGEFRIWQGLKHPSFSVVLSNPAAAASCEVYRVTAAGDEKWVSPSLQAGKTLTVTVPANGYLFFKNFNDSILKIDYAIEH